MNILLYTWSWTVRLFARLPVLKTLLPFALLVLLWQAVTQAQWFPPVFLPGPWEVVQAFGRLTYRGVLPEYLQDSILRLAMGAAAGIAVGIPLGVWVGQSDRARQALWPVLLFFQAIGDIAWLPILLIWFGFSLTTMTVVIVYTVIFPIVFNTVLGVRSIPTDLHRAALSLGASRAQVIWQVVLPGALPNIMTGLRNGLGYGWRALIATEIIVGTSGIGFMMFDARRAGSVVEILLGMVILGAIWYAVDGWILAPIERATGKRWGLVSK